MTKKIRHVDEPRPCQDCKTVKVGLYMEGGGDWLCEKCFKKKYPNTQRIQ